MRLWVPVSPRLSYRGIASTHSCSSQCDYMWLIITQDVIINPFQSLQLFWMLVWLKQWRSDLHLKPSLQNKALQLCIKISTAIDRVEYMFTTEIEAEVEESESATLHQYYREAMIQGYNFAFEVRTKTTLSVNMLRKCLTFYSVFYLFFYYYYSFTFFKNSTTRRWSVWCQESSDRGLGSNT